MNITPTPPNRLDPRGPRFIAAITSVVLAVVTVAGPTLGLPLLIIQAAAFAAGSLLGLRYQPYGWLLRRFVRPRLGAPAQLADERPPRFAQGLGLGLLALAAVGSVLAIPGLFYLGVGLAVVAASLNAVLDFCLGCEIYLLGRRLLARPVLYRVEVQR